LDLFMTNGAVTIREELRGRTDPYVERNLLLRNPGNGGRFIDMAGVAGPAMKVEAVARGAAFGDIDNDGDTDVLISNRQGPAKLLLNSSERRNWLDVRGTGPGLGIGTLVRLERD